MRGVGAVERASFEGRTVRALSGMRLTLAYAHLAERGIGETLLGARIVARTYSDASKGRRRWSSMVRAGESLCRPAMGSLESPAFWIGSVWSAGGGSESYNPLSILLVPLWA